MKLYKRAVTAILYYRYALGIKGVLLFLYSKITRSKPVVSIQVKGISHPVKLRIGTTDPATYLQVLVERHYDFDKPETASFIIDAGANIGLSAVLFANRFPNALIVAIEPEHSNYLMLCENTLQYPQIKPLRAALWSKNEELFLFDRGHGNHGFQIGDSDKENADRVGSVPGITVDAVMRDFKMEKVDLLKIDIEGAELEVFGECSRWLNVVKVIMVELHDEIKPGSSEAFHKATRGFSESTLKGETIMRYAMDGE